MHNPRLDVLTDYPFQRLAALLDGVKPGQSSISMSIGEPQHPVPALLAPALAARPEDWGRYPPAAGTPEWRAAVAGWLARRYALPDGMLSADRCVMPVSGTREALFMVNQVLVPLRKHGRQPTSLMPNPFYQVYLGAAVMAGAEPVLIDAPAATGFLPDFAGQPDEVLDRAAVVTLCSPANPQGAVASLEDWKRLILLARERDFVLIADECYSEIWRGAPPPGALDACRELGGSLQNVLVFNSLSKRSGVPGLRSGFVAGDPDLIARFLRLRNYGAPGMALPVSAASVALWSDETHVEANRALYAEKMTLAETMLGPRLPAFQTPEGGFFLWLPVGNGEVFTRHLWAATGVKILPGAYLAQSGIDGANVGDNYVRVALVHDLATTEDALTRIASVL